MPMTSEVSPGSGGEDDPLLLRGFVEWHRQHFLDAQHRFECGNRLNGIESSAMFPCGPYEVARRGDDVNLDHAGDAVALRPAFAIRLLYLRDPYPHDAGADRAALVFLQMPPSADGAVHLRSNYIAALQTALQRLATARSQEPCTPTKRLHQRQAVTTGDVFGRAAQGKIFASATLFERVAAHAVDAEVHELCRELRGRFRDTDGMEYMSNTWTRN